MEAWQPLFSEYMAEPDNMIELEERLMDLEADFLKSLCEDYLIMLRTDYEYQTSKEAIQETNAALKEVSKRHENQLTETFKTRESLASDKVKEFLKDQII